MINQIIDGETIAPTAWKNGAGLTREIAASAEGFWRFSVAEVTLDVPFSSFPGLMRLLAIVEGDGLELTFPEQRIRVRPLEPMSFSGASRLDARLLGGPIQYFNLIYDEVHRVASALVGHPENLTPVRSAPKLTAIYCLRGSFAIDDQTMITKGLGLLRSEISGQCTGDYNTSVLRIDLWARD